MKLGEDAYKSKSYNEAADFYTLALGINSDSEEAGQLRVCANMNSKSKISYILYFTLFRC